MRGKRWEVKDKRAVSERCQKPPAEHIYLTLFPLIHVNCVHFLSIMLSHKMAVATIMALSATNIVILIVVILSFFKWNIQPASRRRLFLIFLLSCNLFTIAVIPEILFTSLILILQTAENSFFYQWTIFYLIGEQSFLPYSTNPCFKEPVSWTFSLPQIYFFAKHFTVLTMQR